MNGTVGPHDPSPEFRSHLEWQIETALRRESRLSAPVVARLPRPRTALIVIAALALGGVGGMASGYAQENRERDLLMQSARNEVALTQLRLEVAEAEYQDAKRRVDIGVTGRETLLAAETQLQALHSALARTQLDMEEIAATSAAPRNELDAPLVAGRDFVRERLMLDLKGAQAALSASQQDLSRVQRQYDIGLLPKTAALQAQADVAAAQARMQQIASTLEVRQRALRGDIKHDDLPASLRRLELTTQLQSAEREVDVARARLEQARRQYAAGQAAEIDFIRAQLQVLEQQAALRRLQQQLAALGAIKK